MFEGLMASYPKRLDLWNVYLDKEIKAGDLRAARNLLERLVRGCRERPFVAESRHQSIHTYLPGTWFYRSLLLDLFIKSYQDIVY